jgi:hypothetical protein
VPQIIAINRRIDDRFGIAADGDEADIADLPDRNRFGSRWKPAFGLATLDNDCP